MGRWLCKHGLACVSDPEVGTACGFDQSGLFLVGLRPRYAVVQFPLTATWKAFGTILIGHREPHGHRFDGVAVRPLITAPRKLENRQEKRLVLGYGHVRQVTRDVREPVPH